jgi:hypothetical protein
MTLIEAQGVRLKSEGRIGTQVKRYLPLAVDAFGIVESACEEEGGLVRGDESVLSLMEALVYIIYIIRTNYPALFLNPPLAL